MITMGIDVGSIFTKAVLLDNNQVLAAIIRETGGRISEEAEALIGQTLAKGNVLRRDLETITATGQGDELIKEAEYLEDDIACIAFASRHLLPEVELTLDVGGQSITGILSDAAGDILNFMRNDKCASGTGRFIEVIGNALEIPMAGFDRTVSCAVKKVTVSTQCAVFAESEIISHVNQGEAVADIIAGVCESTARIIISQALRFGPVQQYTLTGGVAAFTSITNILQERLPGKYCAFPIDPRLAAAYGAALLGQQE
jgi:(R)-2-hydroxyacyl-CoA dehydratese activating ATPase